MIYYNNNSSTNLVVEESINLAIDSYNKAIESLSNFEKAEYFIKSAKLVVDSLTKLKQFVITDD